MAVHSSVGSTRPARLSGKPPKYRSPSRSKISFSPLAVKGVLRLFTEMMPGGGGEKNLSELDSTPVPLDVHVVPGAIVDFGLGGFDFDGPGAHVQQQVQPAIQQLHGEEVHLVVLLALGVPPVLGLTVREEDQPVGLGGAEVEGDGAHPFGVPFGQRKVGVRGLEVDGVQGGYVFTLENHVPLEFHLWVHYAGQAGQLQPDRCHCVSHPPLLSDISRHPQLQCRHGCL
ncbi:unnamed protein product [Menidia menidia]|uniref:(Atlantic silverside) hypothetical protein n=1 Tax=Menidia menidia TaxID=238744 RepID=A0A8S4B734_9TELE|nr:unnamed protein product [Menidia menidia]